MHKGGSVEFSHKQGKRDYVPAQGKGRKMNIEKILISEREYLEIFVCAPEESGLRNEIVLWL